MDATPSLIVPDSPPIPAEQMPDTVAPPPGLGTPDDGPGHPETPPRAHPTPSAAEVALAVAELAELPKLEYALRRRAEAKRLGLTAVELDTQVRLARTAHHAAKLDAQARAGGVPRGFVLRPSGVHELREGDAPDLHVCGPLRVLARTEDGQGRSHGRLLAWEDAAGRAHEWAMPLHLLAGDGVEVRARLLDEGLFLAPGPAAAAALARYLMASTPGAEVQVVSRVGWHDTPGGRVFVLPGGAMGDGAAVRLQMDREDALPPVASRGELADWRAGVGALCRGNSRLLLAASCAFAAPLLGLLDAEGGGFNLRGDSSTGKTSALIAAGSVWGGGGVRGWVRTWLTTANALEGTALAHNDLLLVLDEMGQAAPEVVAAGAYTLANGAAKARATRVGALRRAGEWRLLFLSSGELTLADRLAEGARGPRAVRAGQEVRVVDVPADAGAGWGLFQHLHGHADGAELAGALTRAARASHGTAGRAFLAGLAEDPDDAAGAVREAQRRFVGEHVPAGADGQVRRVADRFALVAAAGELAAAMGVTPWAKSEAASGVAECFAAWRAARPAGDGPAEAQRAVAAVRHFIGAHGAARFEELREAQGGKWQLADPGRAVTNRAGWRKPAEGGGWRYLILPETWAREVCAGMDTQAAARAVNDAGHLDPQGPGRLARNERVGGPDSVRVYVVRGAILGDSGEAPASPGAGEDAEAGGNGR